MPGTITVLEKGYNPFISNSSTKVSRLLAVVALDPAGYVEGPGVGEEEGAGKEKAVEVLGEGPHLPHT